MNPQQQSAVTAEEDTPDIVNLSRAQRATRVTTCWSLIDDYLFVFADLTPANKDLYTVQIVPHMLPHARLQLPDAEFKMKRRVGGRPKGSRSTEIVEYLELSIH